MSDADFSARRAAFRKLHESGCFGLPNPWDIGSARYLRGLGFKALATSSGGFAFSRGLPDTDRAVSRHMMLEHIAEIVAAVDLPVNADFQSGYAVAPEEIAKNVEMCIETGVAGLSIEDATNDPQKPLHQFALAVDRIRAASAAVKASATGVLLTARAECYLTGHPEPLKESIRRLQAYAEAGADVLYAPGVQKREEIKQIVAAVKPKPVNLLMGSNLGMTMADIAELGVRRVSVGSSLARAAWSGFVRAAKAIAEQGSFAGFDALVPYAELDEFFRQDLGKGDRRRYSVRG